MKRALSCLAVIALLALLLPVGAAAEDQEGLSAVGFSVHGYYRIRYDNTFDASWMTADDSDWWSSIDQRMVLQPTLRISDPIRIHMELDLLNNVLFGQNELDTLPLARTTRKPNQQEIIDNVRYDAVLFNTGDAFSQTVSDTNVDLEEVDPISIRQLYAEILLPIGYLRLGRQASHFGMGLYENSGTPFLRFGGSRPDVNDINGGFDADGGDVYDRLLFGTRVAGFYYPMIMYDRIAQQDFRSGNEDVHGFALANLVRDVRFGESGAFDGGAVIRYRLQDSTDAKIWVYDLWAKLAYGGFTFETEAAALQGKLTVFDGDAVDHLEERGVPVGNGGGQVDVSAFFGVVKADYDANRWGAGLETGFSSPADSNPDNEFSTTAASNVQAAAATAAADEGDAAAQIDFVDAVVSNQSAFGRSISTYAFDSNYNVDLILWEELMGGGVVNGAYFRLGGYIRPLDGMDIQLAVINSYINEAWKGKNGQDASHDLGWETDMGFAYTFHKRFTTGFQFGYFLPGQFFRDVYDDVENVYTLQLKSIVDF